jgi:hypothetical protein
MRKLLAALVAVAGVLVVAPLTSAPVPKRLAGPGTIFVWSDGKPLGVRSYSPDGEMLGEATLTDDESGRVLGVAPGGRHVAVQTLSDRPKRLPAAKPQAQIPSIHLVPLDRAGEKLPFPVAEGWFPSVCWSADGRTAYVSTFDDTPFNMFSAAIAESRTVAHDTATGETEQVRLPRHHVVADVSADGRTLLTYQYVRVSSGMTSVPRLVRGADDDPFAGAADAYPQTFHPDGKRVFATRLPDNGPPEALLVELNSGKESPLGWPAKLKAKTGETPYRWQLSPDGKRVVAMWERQVKKPADWATAEPCQVKCLGVCDLDGGNFKVVYAPEPKTTAEWKVAHVSGFAWR